MKSIKEWLNEYNISYTENGSDYLILCPYHKDKNASLSMDQQSGVFHCWSCGAKGTLVNFISKIANCSIEESKNLIYGKHIIRFNKKQIKNKKDDKDKHYYELIFILYYYLFRDEITLNYLDRLKDFCELNIFDELVKNQCDILEPDFNVYLKQDLYKYLITDDNLFLNKDKLKYFIDAGSKTILKKDIRNALNLLNNPLYRKIIRYLNIEDFLKSIKSENDFNWDIYEKMS